MGAGSNAVGGANRPKHLGCPYCGNYDVDRLYLGAMHVDTCHCRACGAEWEEDVETGQFRGRAGRHSVGVPRS